MLSEFEFRRLTIYYTAALTVGVFAWFGYFLTVAIWGVPVPFMFLLILTSAAAFMLAYSAPLNPHSATAGNQLLFVIAMHLVAICVTMSGFFIAAVAASKDHSYANGLFLSGFSFLIHIAGVVAFVGRTPPSVDQDEEMEKGMESQRKMRKMRRDAKREKMEEKEEDKFLERQSRRDRLIGEATEDHLDELTQQQIQNMGNKPRTVYEQVARSPAEKK